MPFSTEIVEKIYQYRTLNGKNCPLFDFSGKIYLLYLKCKV